MILRAELIQLGILLEASVDLNTLVPGLMVKERDKGGVFQDDRGV